MYSSPNLSAQTKSIFSPSFVQFSACYCTTIAKVIILQPYSSLKKGILLTTTTTKYFFNECFSLFTLKTLHSNLTYSTISDNVLEICNAIYGVQNTRWMLLLLLLQTPWIRGLHLFSAEWVLPHWAGSYRTECMAACVAAELSGCHQSFSLASSPQTSSYAHARP